MIWPMAGNSTCSMPSRSINAWDRLLMSSEVQAKCTNSEIASSSVLPAKRSLTKYSTALTS